jgi:carboxymethylenebutenolidase
MLVRRLSCLVVLVLLVAGCGGDGAPESVSDSTAAETMAEGHEGDTPTATAAAREPDGPVDAREVTYGEAADGTPITGYLAVPSNPDSVLSAQDRDPASAALPGLVVIHEWWGLNDNIRTATRRLAGEGYRALAVDLYADSTADTPKRAQALMKRATGAPEALTANLRAAHEQLQSAGAPRVAILGWCFGGGMTFQALADRPAAFAAAVPYYGTPESMTADVLQQLETPVQSHFGRQDNVVPTKQVEALQSRLDGTGADVQIYEYDAGHAFANPSGKNYDADAATTAWDRTTQFLETHLYPDDE